MDNTAWVGLRSGGLLRVRKVDRNNPPPPPKKNGNYPRGVVLRNWVYADVRQVTLGDVAAGISGQARFANQLYRVPYTVAEHSVLGAVLIEDPAVKLQFLFHDAAEGLGVTDVHFKIKKLFARHLTQAEDAITAALCAKFEVAYPFDPEVKRVDLLMAAYEWTTLHPAKSAIAKAYMIDRTQATVELTPGHRSSLDGWFLRPAIAPAEAQKLWLEKVTETRRLMGQTSAIREGVGEFIRKNPPPFPIPRPLLVPKIAHELGVPEELVEKEVRRRVKKGEIHVRAGFWRLGRGRV